METGIYVRVSTEEQAQEGYSIRAQQEKLKDYARIKEWSIYKIYADEGISGKNIKDRPAINELINDVKNNKIKNVVVFKIDRLTRNTVDLIQLVDLFNKYDCRFNSLMESIDTQTASGRMFLKIIGTFAEFERENIAERVQVGFERRAREGYSTCSAISSYGYDRENGERVQTINEKEAKIVKEIYDMFVNQNLSVTGIAKNLNLRKIPSKRGKYWCTTTVRDVLTNANYIGMVRYAVNEEKRNFETEGKHIPIISTELFEEAQRLLKKVQKISFTKKPREETYYCGFLYCGKCGKKLASHTNKRTKADGSSYLKIDYYCPCNYLKVCDEPSINHNKVEKAFVEYINNIEDFKLNNDFQIEEQENKRKEYLQNKHTYELQLNTLEKKQKEIMNLYVKGDIDFENYRSMKELIDIDKNKIIEELEKINAELNKKIVIQKEDIILNLRENWELLNNVEKRQFLYKFINKIVIVNEKKAKQYFTKILDVEFNNMI